MFMRLATNRRQTEDVISGRNAKNIEYNVAQNFEVATSSSFRDFPKCFVTVKSAAAAVA